MNTNDELQATIAKLIRPGKGILAADESLPTIAKRFQPLSIANTDESRRAYRSLLFTAPGAEEFISGAILFEETLGQRADDGAPLPEVLDRRGIVPGIKVDKGTAPLVNAPGYRITDRNPTPLGVKANAEALASYAAICQAEGIVPIVEPEVLMDGDHTMERCDEVTEAVLHAVFHALHRHKVILECMILKPNMV